MSGSVVPFFTLPKLDETPLTNKLVAPLDNAVVVLKCLVHLNSITTVKEPLL